MTGKHNEGFLALVEDSKTRITEISVDGLLTLQSDGSPFEFVDVREDREYEAGHCEGARHIGKGIIERDIETLIPDREGLIVLYCGGGYRSALAADALQSIGYRRVRSLAGGIRAWREAGLPIELD